MPQGDKSAYTEKQKRQASISKKVKKKQANLKQKPNVSHGQPLTNKTVAG